VLNKSIQELPVLARLKESDRFSQLRETTPPGVLQILQRCLSDEETRATSEELMSHSGLFVFNKLSRSSSIDDEPCDHQVPELELPALHYFLTCESIEKQQCAMAKMLQLMRSDFTATGNYIINNKLYSTIVHSMLTFPWESSRPNLILASIKLGTYMIFTNSAFKEKLKSLGFIKVFLEACLRLDQRRQLYEFTEAFYKQNTLTVLQLANKHKLFSFARDEVKRTGDRSAVKFMKATISYYGNVSLKLIKLALTNSSFFDAEILDMIVDIPIHFKHRDCSEVILMLGKIMEMLKKERRPPDTKLDIAKNIVIIIIELAFYWPWLEYAHAYGCCTSHAASQSLAFCKNPLLFICGECELTLCIPCASKHYHPFTSLEFSGYHSEATLCLCASRPTLSSCDCYLNPSIEGSLEFLIKEEPSRGLSLMVCGRSLTLVEGQDYFSAVLEHDDGPKVLVGGEPLTVGPRTQRTRTLAYFEVEVKSGGIKDSVGIGFSGFEYRGDSGDVIIDGQVQGRGPKFGSYDCIGVGITPSHIYLTYNGILLRPLYPHPVESDYHVLITLEGIETTVYVRLNSNSWLFKPPLHCTVEEQQFVPYKPEFINAGFLNSMKKLMKSCDDYRKIPELAERLADIKSKAAIMHNFDFKRMMMRRSVTNPYGKKPSKTHKAPSDPCNCF
jgi:hypothetical protein